MPNWNAKGSAEGCVDGNGDDGDDDDGECEKKKKTK